MIKIGICDDNQAGMARTAQLIEEYYTATEHGYSIKQYSSSSELLREIENDSIFDILILDIYMPEVPGTQIARTVRDMGHRTQLIFITNSKEHAIDAFAVRAADYLLKPVEKDALFACLDEITLKLSERRKKFKVRNGDGLFCIQIDTISYVELLDRRFIIHTHDGEIVESRIIRSNFEESVSEIYNNDDFVQCQKAFIVNMNHIKNIYRDRFVMRDGREIPILSTFYETTKKRYMDYLLRHDI